MRIAERSNQEPARILVVDDSLTARRAIERIFAGAGDVVVSGEAADGQSAIEAAKRAAQTGQPFHVVILDVEMPQLDGLAALPALLAVRPAPRVIMSSSHTRRGAVTTMRALSLGASDYVCKPVASAGTEVAEFARDLLAKARALARPPAVEPIAPRRPEPFAAAKPVVLPGRRELSGLSRRAPLQAIAFGASTGGPQALSQVLSTIREIASVPVFITQHMPASFTPILAEHLGRTAGRPCAEGLDGEEVRPGRIYVAPGGRHMLVVQADRRRSIRLSDDPPENFCRPAVDPMLRSLAPLYAEGLVSVILTGMGQDGVRGCEEVRRRGGGVIAQDEASSVVWGMPGAVVRRELAQEVLPVDQIGPRLTELLQRRAA